MALPYCSIPIQEDFKIQNNLIAVFWPSILFHKNHSYLILLVLAKLKQGKIYFRKLFSSNGKGNNSFWRPNVKNLDS